MADQELDQREQLIARLAERHAIVSSPAGAGKTALLVDLVLLHASRGIPLSSIVAITFTNKAAGEMKERVVSRLVRGSSTGLLRRYLAGDERLRFSTIHSFFNSLLGSVLPELALTESVSSPAELARFRVDAIRLAFDARDHELAVLEEYLPRHALKKILRELFGRRPLSLCWAEEVARQAQDSPDVLVDRFGSEAAARFYAALARVYLRAEAEYAALKAARGISEFSDIEESAYRLARMPEQESGADWRDFLAFFNDNFSVLLVDEFQDTSTLQWHILEFLVEEWLSGEGIAAEKQTYLYLIGDPKQSIYAFRNADVSVMQGLVERFHELEELKPDLYAHESLAFNHRSAPEIVEVVNTIFADLMSGGESDPLWVTRYEHFRASRTEASGSARIVKLVWPEGAEPSAREAAEKEAIYIATTIRKLLDEGRTIVDRDGVERRLRYSDVAIIVPSRTHLDTLERALARAGIPYISSGGDYTSNRLYDGLKALFTSFGDPCDTGNLKKALCLLGLDADESLRCVGGLRKEDGPEMAALRRAYKEYRRGFERGPSFAFSRAMAALAHQIRGIVSDVESRQALMLLREVFATAESSGVSSPYEMSQHLSTLTVDDLPEIAVSGDAVTILTIHKSKGLEFPVVFVSRVMRADTSLQGASTILMPAERPRVADFAVKLMNKNDKGVREHIREAHEYYASLEGEHARFKEEEEKRLLYVALTRARDYLFVVLSPPPRRISSASKAFYERAVELTDCVDEIDVSRLSLPPAHEARVEAGDASRGLKVLLPAGVTIPPPPRLGRMRKLEQVAERVNVLARDRQALFVGTLAHELIAEFVRGALPLENIEPRARELAASSGVSEEVAADAAACATRFCAMPLPYEHAEAEVGVIQIEEEGYRVMRIDFMAVDRERVTIIDFKTDRQTPEGEQAAAYRRQLEAYESAATRLYPGKPVETSLFMLRSGETIPLEKLAT